MIDFSSGAGSACNRQAPMEERSRRSLRHRGYAATRRDALCRFRRSEPPMTSTADHSSRFSALVWSPVIVNPAQEQRTAPPTRDWNDSILVSDLLHQPRGHQIQCPGWPRHTANPLPMPTLRNRVAHFAFLSRVSALVPCASWSGPLWSDHRRIPSVCSSRGRHQAAGPSFSRVALFGSIKKDGRPFHDRASMSFADRLPPELQDQSGQHVARAIHS